MGVDYKLYLITDRRKCPDGSLFERIERGLKAGIRAVQLREKDMPTRQLMNYATTLREMTKKYDGYLFVNDRVDVALSVEADGVHLGQNSMTPGAVRKITGDSLMIGVSTHSLKEALSAQSEGADFITYGPIYETPSKIKYGKPLGIESVGNILDQVAIPVFAIGGINEGNIGEVMKTGVHGVAMISAILGSEDIETKTRKIVRLLI